MAKSKTGKVVQVLFILVVFGLGYFFGSIDRSPADAQLEDLANQASGILRQSGGVVGQAVELGETIVEMQKHVDGLQKNLKTLRKVQDSLGLSN